MRITELSVIIPSYNAAKWLPITISKIEDAIVNARISKTKSEIILVDDGSSDDTSIVVKEIAKKSSIKVVYVKQKNQGRYLTRKNGVKKAKYNFIWFIDTRVHADPDVLKYVQQQMKQDASAVVWNAHVNVAKKGNVIARFMDSITFIGWRSYFGNPRRTSYGLKEFDKYPKGTTSFLAPTSIIRAAIDEFDKESRDLKVSSDDTHLIRIMARDHQINLSPDFSCTYHARTTLKAFIKHSFHRGQVFIDGFYRWGTRFFIPLNIFLFLTVAAILMLLLSPTAAMYIFLIATIGWLSELFVALLLGVDLKDALSLFILTPIFATCYGLGIWKAVLKLAVKKVSGNA